MAATFRETGAIQNPAYRPTGKFPLFRLFGEPPEISGGTASGSANHICGNDCRIAHRKQQFL